MNRPEIIRALVDDLRGRIRDDELLFSFARSGGPGGQNVNKVNTRVTLWFEVNRCQSLTQEEKLAVRGKLRRRIGEDGRLRLNVSAHRTQGANRAAAVEQFFELLAEAIFRAPPRRPTKKPRSADRRRLTEKRAQSDRKTQRQTRATDET